MPYFEYNNLRVAGIAACVPARVEPTRSTTDQYSDEAYIEVTGVREKRYSNDFTTSDLCQAATERLLTDLGWAKEEVDMLLFVSQTPDYILPATACVLHGKLGLKKDCFAMDISLGCSGWVYGMATACALMQNKVNGGGKKCLLLCGDARKQAYEEPDQLFGFAGTVTALESVDSAVAKPLRFHFGTDGTGYEAIIKPEGGCRNQLHEGSLRLEPCEDGRSRHRLQTRMNGMDVFAFGITTAPSSIKKLCKQFSLDPTAFDYYLFHQANKSMNEQIRKKLRLEAERVPYSMTRFGNTSSASIPLTLVTQISEKVRQRPVKLMCCGFGVGLSWGTLAFETDRPVISDIVEL